MIASMLLSLSFSLSRRRRVYAANEYAIFVVYIANSLKYFARLAWEYMSLNIVLMVYANAYT